MNEDVECLVRECLSTMDSVVANYATRPTYFREVIGVGSDAPLPTPDEAALNLARAILANVLYEELFEEARGPSETLALTVALSGRYGVDDPGLTSYDLEDLHAAQDETDVSGWAFEVAERMLWRDAPELLRQENLEPFRRALQFYSRGASDGE
ncbi:hypothetical protein [Deinococcus aestuarii]|uniref:hypothetical protein n=1 Tax=Deinococcus aestuarii TaxID=2774531 RepID=UPI001C0D5EE5|nr:hypothetical protein [Deinococcus aestuarii]